MDRYQANKPPEAPSIGPEDKKRTRFQHVTPITTLGKNLLSEASMLHTLAVPLNIAS